jgi:hypothetical protein
VQPSPECQPCTKDYQRRSNKNRRDAQDRGRAGDKKDQADKRQHRSAKSAPYSSSPCIYVRNHNALRLVCRTRLIKLTGAKSYAAAPSRYASQVWPYRQASAYRPLNISACLSQAGAQPFSCFVDFP